MDLYNSKPSQTRGGWDMKSRISQLIGQINQEGFKQEEGGRGRSGNQPQHLCFRDRPPISKILRRGKKQEELRFKEESQGNSSSDPLIRMWV